MNGINFTNSTNDLQFIPSNFRGLYVLVDHDRITGDLSARLIEKSDAEQKFDIKIGTTPTFKGIEIQDFDSQTVYITPCIKWPNILTVIKDVRFGNYAAKHLTVSMVIASFGDNIRELLEEIDGI